MSNGKLKGYLTFVDLLSLELCNFLEYLRLGLNFLRISSVVLGRLYD